MRFNLKIILLGGLAYYIAQFVVSMLTGPFIHEGVLVELYVAHSMFWRPELVSDNMGDLLPRWIATGIVASFFQVTIYDNIRYALSGGHAIKGIKFGLISFVFYACFSAGWSGIFNLPEAVWIWWNIEALAIFVIGGAVLGLVVGKLTKH